MCFAGSLFSVVKQFESNCKHALCCARFRKECSHECCQVCLRVVFFFPVPVFLYTADIVFILVNKMFRYADDSTLFGGCPVMGGCP